MTTFSDIVDAVAKETGKGHATDRVSRVVNQAIRHVEKASCTPLILCEEYLAQVEPCAAIVWTIPNIKRFIKVTFAEDPVSGGCEVKKTEPSHQMQRYRRDGVPFYYYSGSCVNFGQIRCGVRFSYSMHSPWFKYEKPGAQTNWDGDTTSPDFDKVSSLTLCVMSELIEEQALLMLKNRDDDPSARNQEREHMRAWDNHTAAR